MMNFFRNPRLHIEENFHAYFSGCALGILCPLILWIPFISLLSDSIYGFAWTIICISVSSFSFLGYMTVGALYIMKQNEIEEQTRIQMTKKLRSGQMK